MSDLYAKAGERITCENGHVIAAFVKDVKHGAPFSPDAIGRWQDPEPRIGAHPKDIVCCRCGAEWVKCPSMFHVEGEWRGAKGETSSGSTPRISSQD